MIFYYIINVRILRVIFEIIYTPGGGRSGSSLFTLLIFYLIYHDAQYPLLSFLLKKIEPRILIILYLTFVLLWCQGTDTSIGKI